MFELSLPPQYLGSGTEMDDYPEKFSGKAPSKAAARKEVRIDLPGNNNKVIEAHMHNWIEAIQRKAKVIAPTRGGSRSRDIRAYGDAFVAE